MLEVALWVVAGILGTLLLLWLVALVGIMVTSWQIAKKVTGDLWPDDDDRPFASVSPLRRR